MVSNSNKKHLKQNTKDEYERALASSDPLEVSQEELQNAALDAAKKFRSLSKGTEDKEQNNRQ